MTEQEFLNQQFVEWTLEYYKSLGLDPEDPKRKTLLDAYKSGASKASADALADLIYTARRSAKYTEDAPASLVGMLEKTDSKTEVVAENKWLYRLPKSRKTRADKWSRDDPTLGRFALNVKPDIKLARLMDAFCDKYKCYYKVPAQGWDTRVDTMVVYSKEAITEAMEKEIAKLAAPYVRKELAEKTNALDGRKIADGVFTAKELGHDDIMNLFAELRKALPAHTVDSLEKTADKKNPAKWKLSLGQREALKTFAREYEIFKEYGCLDKKNPATAVCLSLVIKRLYSAMREADFDDSRIVSKDFGEYTGKARDGTSVENDAENNWNYRKPAAVDWRITDYKVFPKFRVSLNTVADNRLIDALDAYFSAIGAPKGYYKTPSESSGYMWKHRTDPITLYFEKPLSAAELDAIGKIVSPFANPKKIPPTDKVFIKGQQEKFPFMSAAPEKSPEDLREEVRLAFDYEELIGKAVVAFLSDNAKVIGRYPSGTLNKDKLWRISAGQQYAITESIARFMEYNPKTTEKPAPTITTEPPEPGAPTTLDPAEKKRIEESLKRHFKPEDYDFTAKPSAGVDVEITKKADNSKLDVKVAKPGEYYAGAKDKDGKDSIPSVGDFRKILKTACKEPKKPLDFAACNIRDAEYAARLLLAARDSGVELLNAPKDMAELEASFKSRGLKDGIDKKTANLLAASFSPQTQTKVNQRS